MGMFRRHFFSCLLLLASTTLLAQEPTPPAAFPSHWGYTGLATIPTATFEADGTIGLGASYLPVAYATLPPQEQPERLFYIAHNFLPGFEVSGSIARPLHSDGWGLGTRAINLKLRVLKEGKHLPAVAVGVLDGFGAVRFTQAFWVVASKSLHLSNQLRLLVHGGYGAPHAYRPSVAGGTPRLERQDLLHLVGPFAGAELQFYGRLSVACEAHSRGIQGALRLRMLRHVVWSVGTNATGAMALGVGASWQLPVAKN